MDRLNTENEPLGKMLEWNYRKVDSFLFYLEYYRNKYYLKNRQEFKTVIIEQIFKSVTVFIYICCCTLRSTWEKRM